MQHLSDEDYIRDVRRSGYTVALSMEVGRWYALVTAPDGRHAATIVYPQASWVFTTFSRLAVVLGN